MKKFRFPLHSVSTVRNLSELRARENFSKVFNAFVECEGRLKAARLRLKESEELLRVGRASAFRAAEQVTFLAAFANETITATQIESELATARQALEAARQAWLETRRDLRVIDNLEGKARLDHRQALEREAQADLDDRTCGQIARKLKIAS